MRCSLEGQGCQKSYRLVKHETETNLRYAASCSSHNHALVESSWNVMAHGDAREGMWMGNWWMQWVASTLHTTSEHGVSSITTADAHTSAASSRLNWRPPADLNGLVRFAERPNVVSARVPSHFNWSLTQITSSPCRRQSFTVTMLQQVRHYEILPFLILSHDMSTTFSKASLPSCAIWFFLSQIPVWPPFLNVI